MAADIVVRPVAQADFDRWKPLWDGYNAFYGREGPTALPEENVSKVPPGCRRLFSHDRRLI